MTILSAISTICAIIFGYTAFSRTKTRDHAAGAKHNATVLTEIGYIKSGIDDIKRKQERTDDQYLELSNRMTKVETSVSNAHKRINELVDLSKGG